MTPFNKQLCAILFVIIFIPFNYPEIVKGESEGDVPPELKRSSRIVGGDETEPGAYPWTAQIGYDHPDARNFEVWCGGALIHRLWVLSAAHCFDDTTASRYTLTLGEHDINQDEGTEQIHDIAEIIIHPDYQASTNDNDIALSTSRISR